MSPSPAAPLLADKIIIFLKSLPWKSMLTDFQKRGSTVKRGRSSSLHTERRQQLSYGQRDVPEPGKGEAMASLFLISL